MPQAATPLVSVVIPNYNGAAQLGPCLRALARQTLCPTEIVIADNGSSDGSLELIERLAPEARILRLGANLGFAGAVNAGIRAAQGDWVAVLNNDTEVSFRWLEEGMAALERHPDIDFVACRILDMERRDRVFSAGDCFLRAGVGYRRGQERPDDARYAQEVEVFAASGCAALFRKSALDALGGFDESFFAYLEDVDLGLRFQATGSRGWYAPGAVVYHRGGATSGGEFSPLSVRLRTRNALLILAKSVPGSILWRSAPMVLIAQAVWLGRCAARGRIWSYLRGLAEIPARLPAAVRARRAMRDVWQKNERRLWESILRSEALAREDFSPREGPQVSLFLSWYFRLF
jgi:GT2 family glycosyltransferase